MNLKRMCLPLALAAAVAACSRPETMDIATGSDVKVETRDGASVEGRVVEVRQDRVVIEMRDGVKKELARTSIASVRSLSPSPATAVTPGETSVPTTGAAAAPAPAPAPVEAARSVAKSADAAPAPAYREVTLPAGTVLPVELGTTVASASSNVEDPVRGRLRRPVMADGVEALPVGTAVMGHVTAAERSGRVKGRANVAFRFTQIDLPGAGGRQAISTGTIARTAPATKKQDAAKIGAGAAGGAIIGGIIGGGDGAAKGAAIGGGAGTGVVMATRGKEITLPAGTPVSVKLTAPLTVRVLARR